MTDITLRGLACNRGKCPVCGSGTFWEKTAVRVEAVVHDRRFEGPWPLGSSRWERLSETFVECFECGLQFGPTILDHEETQ